LSGVTGAFTAPVEGFQKDGAKGLLTGVVKGAAGLVVKPISGTLDIITKTTQGLSN